MDTDVKAADHATHIPQDAGTMTKFPAFVGAIYIWQLDHPCVDHHQSVQQYDCCGCPEVRIDLIPGRRPRATLPSDNGSRSWFVLITSRAKSNSSAGPATKCRRWADVASAS